VVLIERPVHEPIMRITTLTFALPLALAGTFACMPAPSSTPAAVFEQVWTDFDDYYGLFVVKGVDWDRSHDELQPRVDDDTSDAELHAVLVDMLEPLEDAHVTLYPATSPALPTWSFDLVDGRFPLPAMSLSLVEQTYLDDAVTLDAEILVGRLSPELGYIHVPHFDASGGAYRRALDDALEHLEGIAGLVVDVRDNPGGYDTNAQYVAGRFARERRPYMSVRKRSGPGREDFAPPIVWHVAPTGDRQFTGPIALLTSHATQSAGETFGLAMRERDDLVALGTTTAGAFSDAILREAGNGWAYTISVGDYRAADGRSYEGIGLAPDVEVESTVDDLDAGRDRVLEAAITELEARVRQPS
jgi:carboxyl-terminal processing protease